MSNYTSEHNLSQSSQQLSTLWVQYHQALTSDLTFQVLKAIRKEIRKEEQQLLQTSNAINANQQMYNTRRVALNS